MLGNGVTVMTIGRLALLTVLTAQMTVFLAVWLVLLAILIVVMMTVMSLLVIVMTSFGHSSRGLVTVPPEIEALGESEVRQFFLNLIHPVGRPVY